VGVRVSVSVCAYVRVGEQVLGENWERKGRKTKSEREMHGSEKTSEGGCRVRLREFGQASNISTSGLP